MTNHVVVLTASDVQGSSIGRRLRECKHYALHFYNDDEYKQSNVALHDELHRVLATNKPIKFPLRICFTLGIFILKEAPKGYDPSSRFFRA